MCKIRISHTYYRFCGGDVVKTDYCKLSDKRDFCKVLIELNKMTSAHGVDTFKKVKKKSLFKQYVSSIYWKWFRELYKLSDRPQHCIKCGDTRFQLHHLTYDRRGNELLDDVIPLCWKHHREVHRPRVVSI